MFDRSPAQCVWLSATNRFIHIRVADPNQQALLASPPGVSAFLFSACLKG